MPRMSAKRAAALTIGLALIGLAISATIASVHAKLESSQGYTSFCNVNETVNCDLVLSSEYAYLFGVPVAWWALLAYVAVAACAVVAMRAPRATRRRQAAGALFVMAILGTVFSAYLAYVALFVLEAVCLLCSGLYLVQVGLIVSSALLWNAVGRRTSKAGAVEEAWPSRFLVGGAVAVVVGFIAISFWEASGGSAENLSKAELVERQPEFSRWYMNLPVTPVSSEGGHRKGGAASVVMIEFSDFECGHCARAFRNLKTVLPRFGNDVSLVFHHFPLDSSCNPNVTGKAHRFACLAAMASECAAEQGKFWEYHDLLFANQSSLDRDNLLRYADQLSIDRSKFLACLESDRPRRRIEQDVSEGKRLGVASTPTFFLNGRFVAGALEVEKLEHAIRLERASAQKTS
jgi:protein-disulfide isomerase/uncharacterized membrane protein